MKEKREVCEGKVERDREREREREQTLCLSLGVFVQPLV